MLIDPLTTFCKKSLWMLHKTAGSRRQKLEDIWWIKGYELPSSIEKNLRFRKGLSQCWTLKRIMQSLIVDSGVNHRFIV